MVLVVQDAAKKPFVGLVHQLINIGHVRWIVMTTAISRPRCLVTFEYTFETGLRGAIGFQTLCC